MTAVSVHAYARSHTSVYVSDKLRNLLKILAAATALTRKRSSMPGPIGLIAPPAHGSNRATSGPS